MGPEALQELLDFPWPGNVRQLANLCGRLATLTPPDGWIGREDLRHLCPDLHPASGCGDAEVRPEDEDASYRDSVSAWRERLVLDRLRLHEGNPFRAAASLGISPSTFYRYWRRIRQKP